MALLTIIVIALGLAMDAFAVSIASGAAYKQLKIKQALRIAVFFGGFQALMPLIGFLAGLSIKAYIGLYDHWVAFGLLSAVGGKMIYESFKIKPVPSTSSGQALSRAEGSAGENLNPSNILILLVLSVATSIDALAVGITLSLLRVSLAMAVSIIGLVTFVLSYLGVSIGKRFGHFFEHEIEALGGIVLICIGLKILLEHML
jgi:putative Mn2+ efflux pump MntP